ncbi:MAG: DNA polymerase Y family protein [Streptosporangiaceae bacterium]|jgi:protein ImuB
MSARDSVHRRVLAVYCPDWLPEAPDADAAREFERVVSVVEEFCPQVEVLRPGVCAIAALGPARYFGGEEQLARKISDAVTGRGFACRCGVADGMFAALLAARQEPSGVVVPPGAAAAFLAPLPVAVLAIPELDDVLPRLGLTTLGEFAALPPAEAAGRFGTQGALAHRLARGLDPRPLAPRPPTVDFSAEREFDPPAEQSEPVVFAAKALADQMDAVLAVSGLSCVRLQVQVVCENGQEITRLWRHDGLLSALAVAERVRWQLDGWRAGREAGARGRHGGRPGPASKIKAHNEGAEVSGITLLRLVPDQLTRAEGRQLGLWGDAIVSDRVARAAVRVQAMLGHGAVTRPVLAGGRSPAEQVMLVPFGDAGAPSLPPDRPWPGKIPAPAPATVYPAPRPARITDSAGEPVTITARAQVSGFPARLSADGGPPLAVTSWAGPWPVTERWWVPDQARRQARFQLVTEDGSAWLAVVQEGCWLIEASYD